VKEDAMSILELEHAKGSPDDAVVHESIRVIRGDVMLARLSALSDVELSEWCSRVDSGLQMWVAGRDSAAVIPIYYELGRAGAAAGIPSSELVRALGLVLNLARQELRKQPNEPADCDVSQPLTTFCDYARYYLIRGYEDALR
jgi:hypothetical protein